MQVSWGGQPSWWRQAGWQERAPSGEGQDVGDARDAQVVRDLLAKGLGGALGGLLLLLDQLVGRHHPLPQLLRPGSQGHSLEVVPAQVNDVRPVVGITIR